MRIEFTDYCQDKLIEAAKEMALAARTAPKGRGRDQLHIVILTGGEKDKLAQQMERIGKTEDIAFFLRDAQNLKNAPVILLLGTECGPLEIPHCGYCGFADCRENREHSTAPCAFSTGDLGIAVGSAAAYAARRHIDNRIMFSAGRGAIDLGFFQKQVKVAYGLPLSATGKNPFFDRK
ncbi:MAG: DUF2148 domain-containing protein [Pseudomonadota bacterium]|jgi:uncharacterized ferredoxin-like protein